MTPSPPRVVFATIVSLALHALVLSMAIGDAGARRPSAAASSLRLVVVPVTSIAEPAVASQVAASPRPAPRRIDAPPNPVLAKAASIFEATAVVPLAQNDPGILTLPQYRVALAFATRRSLVNAEPISNPETSVGSMRATVRLSFGAAGELVDVRLRDVDLNSDLDAQFAAQALALARRGAQALPVPFALQGRAFHVDLVIVGETTQATR
jgi:hypothetical protein